MATHPDTTAGRPTIPLPGASAPPIEQAGRPPCPRPADFLDEIERYDRTAEVGLWDGTRYRMTYRVLGDGPPLIVARGIAGSYRGLSLLLNRLAERFRTIQYEYPGDLPGDGARLRSISHEDLADDLSGLLDHLRVGRAFPLGISFGSTVVLKAMHRSPRRFPKAIVQGAFARRRFTFAERLALACGRLVPGTSCRLPMHRRVVSWNSMAEFPSVIADRWPIFLEHSGQTRIASLAHRVALLTKLDLRPILPEIRAEVLAIRGKEDRIVPSRLLEPLREGLSKLQVHVLPVAGHQLHYTHAELFAGLVEGALLGCPPSGCPSRGPGPDRPEGPRSVE